MCRRTLNICWIARWSMNAISQPRRAALLGALLLAASLPADILAAVAGRGPAGRHLVLQVRGSG